MNPVLVSQGLVCPKEVHWREQKKMQWKGSALFAGFHSPGPQVFCCCFAAEPTGLSKKSPKNNKGVKKKEQETQSLLAWEQAAAGAGQP